MMQQKRHHHSNGMKGISVVETLVVVAIAGILTAIAVPQMYSQRRLIRSASLTRELMTQMRYARQLAMSQQGATAAGALRRVAYTFQYDDATKQVSIIGPIPAGTASLVDPNYPNIAGSRVVSSTSLLQGGLPRSEVSYGIPPRTYLPSGAPDIPTGPLPDGVSQTALTNNLLNITFQPDGSVIDTTNNPQDRALFMYNNRAVFGTASAISVLGASGRVKIWRYYSNVNAYRE